MKPHAPHENFDCHYDGDINRCDKDCKQLGECKRRTSGVPVHTDKESSGIPTPRCDALTFRDGVVGIEFARQLERELIEARRQRDLYALKANAVGAYPPVALSAGEGREPALTVDEAHAEICELFARNVPDEYYPKPGNVQNIHEGLSYVLSRVASSVAAELLRSAEALREAQRNYMADRGNDEKGKLVALAAGRLDAAILKARDAGGTRSARASLRESPSGDLIVLMASSAGISINKAHELYEMVYAADRNATKP